MIKGQLRADTLLQSVSVAVVLAIVCRMVAFGRGVLLTRTLSPEELGIWALVANAIALLAFFFTLGVPNGLARYTERFRSAGTHRKFFAATLVRCGGFTALFCVAGFLFWPQLGQVLFANEANRPLVWLTLTAVAATVGISLLQGILQGMRLFRLNSLVELGQNLSFLGLAVLLFGFWQGDATVVAWANLWTTMAAVLLVGFWLAQNLTASETVEPVAPANSLNSYWWPILAYSLGAWSAGSLQALWRVIDRYMLLHLSSAGAAETLDHIGQYYIASKLGQPLGALAGVVSMALLPHAAKLWESNRRSEVTSMVHLSTKLAVLIMTFGGALLIALKGWVIPLVAGRSAEMTTAIFAPVLLTVVAVSVHFILRTYLMCKEQTWRVTSIWIVTLLANAVLNYVLIPKYALWGAAWATMLSGGLAVALTVAFSKFSGMRIGGRLVFCLALPCMLLLPNSYMVVSLSLIAALTQFTNWIFDDDEKRLVNQHIAQRCQRFFPGQFGALLTPQA